MKRRLRKRHDWRGPPDAWRLELERELTGCDLATLADWCRLLDIPREKWLAAPAMRQVVELVAVLRRQERLGGSCSKRAAELGFDPETILVRHGRWIASTAA